MTTPKNVTDEARVEFLRSLNILDTAADVNLDRVVSICRTIFDVPISDISLIDSDRQWFKSMQGLDIDETSRQDSFCNIRIRKDEIFEVPDALENEQLKSNPYVVGKPFIRYYMGAPITVSGYRIGSLCIMDTKPKEPATAALREILLNLAAIVSREIYLQHLVREAIPVLLSAVSTTSTATGTGTLVSEGTGTTTTIGTGTTTTTGSGTTVTTGTGTTTTTGTGTTTTTTTSDGTTTSTGSGTTTTTGMSKTTSTGTGTTTRTGEGTTTSETPGLEVTTTNDVDEAKKASEKKSKGK